MRLSFFYHSLISDWNHGNAHFLRGVVSDLLKRGHDVHVYEPADGWSLENLIRDHGPQALQRFHEAYPALKSTLYHRESLDMEQIAQDSDVVIVHEWNEPWLVNGFGELRDHQSRGNNSDQNFCLLFHDTHHRAVSDAGWLKRFKLESYDGILAFGDVLSNVYRTHGWSDTVWTWHEAADTQMFYPREPNNCPVEGDVVWIGNWGDDERTRELDAFLFRPVRELQLSCNIFGVRYPQTVLKNLHDNGIRYHGWLANFDAPRVFANHKVTVHVPRRYYRESLPGIPTIRPFEAMACGIPLICAPWQDSEALFTAGADYLVANNTMEMKQHLRDLLNDEDRARELASHALTTIRNAHTCSHRVDQLLKILDELGVDAAAEVGSADASRAQNDLAELPATASATSIKPAVANSRSGINRTGQSQCL